MLDSTLHRFGCPRSTGRFLSQAIERHGRVPVDLLVLPLDDVDDAGLAAIDRTVWREHELRVIATVRLPIPVDAARDAQESGVPRSATQLEEECHSAVERLPARGPGLEIEGAGLRRVRRQGGGVGGVPWLQPGEHHCQYSASSVPRVRGGYW
ncbi:MAG: hypothetical protein IPP90_16315, partial [Gemmatimonadaceae bacterium]|nr:hypothetical protein [Gemmatimonadaceae bacterium]